jgi:hypothetical protein
VFERLNKTAQNELANITTLFLGVTIGSTMNAESFLNFDNFILMHAMGVSPVPVGGGVNVIVGKISVGCGGGGRVFVGLGVEDGFGVFVGCCVSVGNGVSVETGSGVSVIISNSSVGEAASVGVGMNDGVNAGTFGTYNFCPVYIITAVPIQLAS